MIPAKAEAPDAAVVAIHPDGTMGEGLDFLLSRRRRLFRAIRCFFKGHGWRLLFLRPPNRGSAIGFVVVTCLSCGKIHAIPSEREPEAPEMLS